jgi:hypothetical protein
METQREGMHSLMFLQQHERCANTLAQGLRIARATLFSVLRNSYRAFLPFVAPCAHDRACGAPLESTPLGRRSIYL